MIDFKTFERAKAVSAEAGDVDFMALDESLSEGVISGIANFFSRKFGGRVSKVDKLIKKYKDNEASYWSRWADANFKINSAEAQYKTTSDTVEREKFVEMQERAEKLLRQIDRTRDEINAAVDETASMLVKGSARLQDYYHLERAKADEEVAQRAYTELKKLADPEVVETLYQKVEADSKVARAKDEEFRKKYGELSPRQSVSPGQYSQGQYNPYNTGNAGNKQTGGGGSVPLRSFGITNVEDFILSSDMEFDDKTKKMPRANLKELLGYMKRYYSRIEADVKDETDAYAAKLKTVRDGSATNKDTLIGNLENSIKKAKDASSDDLKLLDTRINALENKVLVGV